MPDSRFQFSNFQHTPVVLDGVEYPTVEHAYQAAKSDRPEVRQRIQECETPGQAKRMGGNLHMTNSVRAHWEQIKVRVMYDLLVQKFTPGSYYARTLLRYEQRIVEWNTWHDNEWGICTCPSCPGRGKNKLGKLLRQIREELWKSGHDR